MDRVVFQPSDSLLFTKYYFLSLDLRFTLNPTTVPFLCYHKEQPYVKTLDYVGSCKGLHRTDAGPAFLMARNVEGRVFAFLELVLRAEKSRSSFMPQKGKCER